MPYISEHAARIESPDIFENDSFRRKEIAPGVEIIIGKHRNADTTATQAYRFDASKFNPSEAEKWLKDNDVKYMTFEPAKKDIEQSYMLPIVGIIGDKFKYTDLLMHLNAAKNATVLECIMDSPGGYIDEGLKITEALNKCGKIIKMRNSGDVASIAVSIFLTASKENRFFNPSKGQFLVHCPLVDPKDMQGNYTAEDLTVMAKQLKSYESDLVKQYVNSTGSDSDILKAFMQENKPLTPEQISSLGFATIEQPQFKAVALINTNKMDNKEVIDKLDKHESLLDKIHRKLFAKNIMLQDVNGVEIDFGDAVQTPDQVIVGVKGTVDGKPAEGEYTLADGKTYVFVAGELTEIKEPNQGNEMEVELEALKAENTELKSKIEAVNKMQEDAKKELETAKTEFKAFKAQFSNEPPRGNAPPTGENTTNRVAKFLTKKE